MLAKSKLSSIETLISQALTDMDINHEEFVTILNEKDKYKKMKDNLRCENRKYKIMRLSGEIKDLSEKLLSILCHQKNSIIFYFYFFFKA